MEKIVFQTDDPEIIDFVYSLGRSRSVIINTLLRDCMNEGGGYVSPKIMAETGFSYKNKKPIIKFGKSSVKKTRQSVKHKPSLKELVPQKAAVSQKTNMYKVEEKLERIVVSEPVIEESMTDVDTEHVEPKLADTEQEGVYTSSAPKICNTNLVMAGLSAFNTI